MSTIERVIEIGEIENLLAEEGAVIEVNDNVISSSDPETGVTMTHVLVQDDDGVGAILFNTIVLKQLKKKEVDTALCLNLLSIDNGINTSNFRLIPDKQGFTLVLQNFAKLQNMGEEDVDDILSALSFLVEDLTAARRLFGEVSLIPKASPAKKATAKKAPAKATAKKATGKPATKGKKK